MQLTSANKWVSECLGFIEGADGLEKFGFEYLRKD